MVRGVLRIGAVACTKGGSLFPNEDIKQRNELKRYEKNEVNRNNIQKQG